MYIDAIVKIVRLSLTVMAYTVFDNFALWNRFVTKLSFNADCAILKLSKLIHLSILFLRATIAVIRATRLPLREDTINVTIRVIVQGEAF